MNRNTGRGVVLITGASSGLGEEMARQFAVLGYDLALCARRTDRLETLAAEIRTATGRRVETDALDVTNSAAVTLVFHAFAQKFGTIDRVVVNAGIGKGAALGTGRADANLATAMTNFVGALSQTEAALEIFRRQGRGHLVLISSVSALRGMRRSMTTGVMVGAIEKRRARAYVPAWPWVPIGFAIKHLPLSIVRRLT